MRRLGRQAADERDHRSSRAGERTGQNLALPQIRRDVDASLRAAAISFPLPAPPSLREGVAMSWTKRMSSPPHALAQAHEAVVADDDVID